MPTDIRLSRSDIGISEYLSVIKCLKKGMLGMGQEVAEFENLLANYLNSNVVCVSSGTAALHLALEALNLDRGSEVLVPSLTYVATFQAITAAGMVPKSVDIDPDTGNISCKYLENALTSKCKVVLPVLYAGNTSHYRNIIRWAKAKSLRVVCDAAHAFGSVDKGELVGSFGDITCFSFDGIKNITSGEGGCIVSKDLDVINLSKDKRLLSVHKDSEMRYENKRSWDFDVSNQGWRYHMSNVHASLGISQFKRRNAFFRKRKKIAKLYDLLLNDSKVLKPFKRNYEEIVPHIYPVLLNDNINREGFINYLRRRRIQIGIHYKPNHCLTFFKSDISLKNTEDTYSRLISLPIHTLLRKRTIKYIVNCISSFEPCI